MEKLKLEGIGDHLRFARILQRRNRLVLRRESEARLRRSRKYSEVRGHDKMVLGAVVDNCVLNQVVSPLEPVRRQQRLCENGGGISHPSGPGAGGGGSASRSLLTAQATRTTQTQAHTRGAHDRHNFLAGTGILSA